MAINPIKLLTAPSAQATNNSLIVTVFGNIDCSRVYEGTSVQIAGYNVVEGVSGTAPDGNGESTITLRYVWPEDTTTGRLTAWNTFEGLGNAIQRAKDIVEQTAGIESLAINGLVNKIGDTDYETVPITDKGKELLASDDTSVLRTALDLGNAAEATVAEGRNDTTVGRLLKIGDSGYGGYTPISSIGVSANDYTNSGHFYLLSPTNVPESGNGYMDVVGFSSLYAKQNWKTNDGDSSYERVLVNGTWQSWYKVASAANNSLIEYGSNANGSYTKFPDGTMICRINLYTASAINIQSGSVYVSHNTTWTFPHIFNGVPEISHSVKEGDSSCWVGHAGPPTVSTTTYFRAFRGATTAAPVKVSVIAVGRWK